MNKCIYNANYLGCHKKCFKLFMYGLSLLHRQYHRHHHHVITIIIAISIIIMTNSQRRKTDQINHFAGSFCKPPCFTITPVSHLRVTLGEDIIIRWKYSANIPLQLAQWGSYDKDGKIKALIAQKHGNDKIEYSASSYKNRAFIEKDNSSMRLIDVKHEDSGYFGCTFKFQGGFELKNITNLYVASRSSGKYQGHLV